MNADWLPSPGALVANRFRVANMIGEGGMGAVLAAEHVEIGGRVAIKFLHPNLAQDAEALERFVREAKVAAQIRSEHVVRVIDVGRTDAGLPYIVMDLLEGADLGKVSAASTMPISLAVDCVLQAGEALAEAHAQGIVHRDIKPANLWLARRRDGSPSVKVLDFGISKLIPLDRHTAGLTDTKASFGSPAYMSPEQIRSVKRVDHRTDIWALGVVLFELLTGKLPFDADNVAGILAAIISDPPSRLGKLRPDAPPEIELAIRGALEKDLARRGSLAELALRLRPFAGLAGQLAADRIVKMHAPPVASVLPPPAPSTDELIALGRTEPILRPPPSRWLRFVLPLLAVGIATVGTAVGLYLVAKRPAIATPVTASAVETPSVMQPPAPPPSETAAAPALSMSAAASASAPVSGAKTAPKGTHRPAPPPAPAPAPTSPFSEGRL